MAQRMPAPEVNDRFEQTMIVAARPEDVFAAFFSADALRQWWQAIGSVTTPVPFGVYAIEWVTTTYRDDLLGPLGGVFHGTVVDVRPGHLFLVADAYWIPPEGDPIGPMALQVTCHNDDAGCRLHVRQDGYEPSPRWRRYYAVIARGWQISLTALKRHLERAPTPAASGPIGVVRPAAPPEPEESRREENDWTES